MKKICYQERVSSLFPYVRKRCVLLFILLLVSAMFVLSGISAEGAEEGVDEVIGYESVLICHGDSVWSIAEANMKDPTNAQIRAYVDEIVSLNDITSSRIDAGNYILLPKHRKFRNENQIILPEQNVDRFSQSVDTIPDF